MMVGTYKTQVDKQGAYVVNTIADLVSVPINILKVFVIESLSGGYFTRYNSGVANNGTVFNAISNTYFVRDDIEIGKFRPEWFGAKRDGTTDDSSAIQSAANLGIVLLQDGVYRTGTITIPYGIEGVSEKTTVLRALSSYTNGEKLVIIPTGTGVRLSKFMILGSNLQNFNALWMAHLTTAGGSGVAGVNQFYINDVRIYGCNTALTLDGWIGSISKMYIAQATLGFKFFRVNNVVIDMEIENCVQYFDWYNTATGNETSASVSFTKLLCESTIAGMNTVSSKVDGVSGLDISSLYLEGVQGENNTIEFGTRNSINGQCRGLVISGYSCAILPSSTFKKIIKFDIVNGITLNGIMSTSSGNALNYDHITTTQNTKNFTDNLSMTFGARFSKNGTGKKYNYFPNSRFDGGINCSVALSLTATPILALDTAEKLTGINSLKVQATAGLAAPVLTYMFQAGSSVVKQLAGKSISLAAWVKIPNTYSLSPTTKPSIGLQIYSGQATLFPAFTPSSIIVNEYMLWVTPVAYCDPTLTNIYVQLSPGKNGATADGTEYINIDSVFLVEGDCSNLILNTGIPDSPLMDLYVEGDRVIFKYLPPAASVEPYVRIGDKYHYGATVTTYIGKVASADSQAFASWKNFGATV